MTQEQAVMFLLRTKGFVPLSTFLSDEHHLAASYRRAITMLRHKLKSQGMTIRRYKTVIRDGVTVLPSGYRLTFLDGTQLLGREEMVRLGTTKREVEELQDA